MIKRFINQLEEFFGISRKEARGTLVLLVLLFFLIWTPFVFRRWILPHFPLPATDQSAAIQRLDSIVAELDKSENNSFEDNRNAEGDHHKADAKPIRLFPFDPNMASITEMTDLGIPLFLAKRIDKYRSKGGKFRKKEDLLHIYDFPPETYKRLEPYITLPAKNNNAFTKTETSKPDELPANRTYAKEATHYTKPVSAPFDINTTDTTQLIKLKGIGSKLSLRILKFRDGLGGFHSTSQFGEIFGLDSLALAELNKYARVGSPVKKININTATVEELSSHSYLRNKRLASVIVNYRSQHGNYSSVEDLRKVKVLDENTINKLGPYLSF